MITKVELFEGKAYILDDFGRVWQMDTDYDRQPALRLVVALSREAANSIMEPQLARFAPR